MEREMTFENNKGNKLYGILSNPNSNNNCPIIIMCHGLNSNKNSSTILELEKIFSNNNIWIKAGKKVKIHTLIIHGTMDEDVELQLAKELAESIKGSQLKLFEGADHKFSNEKDFKKCIKAVSDFIIMNINIV